MRHDNQPDPAMPTESFPTGPTGLPEAGRPALLELAPGDTLDLRVGPVAKRLSETTVRMLGHNGSIPGPLSQVRDEAARGLSLPQPSAGHEHAGMDHDTMDHGAMGLGGAGGIGWEDDMVEVDRLTTATSRAVAT